MGEMKKTEYKNYPNPVEFKGNVRSITRTTEILPIKGVIKAGTFLDIATPEIHKSGKTAAAWSAATSGNMDKEHSFGVGDHFFDGSTDLTITAIDESNADYDVFTLSGAATLTDGEVVYNTNAGAVASGSVVIVDSIVFDSDDTVHFNVSDIAVINSAKLQDYRAVGYTGELIKTY